MKTYPICLINLEAKRCVVVGGGDIAARKTAGLCDAGAHVLVISPELVPSLQEDLQANRISWLQRAYRSGDLDGSFLVIAATDDPRVNADVWQECRRIGCLVNVVDDPERCNFILPSLVRREELAIAITTGGASPALARRLREKLEGLIGPEYGVLASILGELRPTLTSRIPAHRRLESALELIDSNLLEVIRSQGKERAFALARERLDRIVMEAQESHEA